MSITVERLFFALWPDQKVRESLSEAYAKIPQLSGQGRLVNPANFHITLHFLGNIPVQQVACFLDYARQVQSQPFQLEITQSGYFKKPQISWLAPVEIPRALIKLQGLLGRKIRNCGFQPEVRTFRPHVTMARKITQNFKMQQIETINWHVDSFALVESVSWSGSVEYQVKSSFPLIEKPATGI